MPAIAVTDTHLCCSISIRNVSLKLKLGDIIAVRTDLKSLILKVNNDSSCSWQVITPTDVVTKLLREKQEQ